MQPLLRFDLDAVVFSVTSKLEKAAIERAKIQDAAVITHMEIARQTFILPRPTIGDIASIVADERGGRITVDDPVNGGRPATFDLLRMA